MEQPRALDPGVKSSEAMSGLTDSELLDASCAQVSQFPNNILHQTTPQHHVDSYGKRLDEREPFMLSEDGSAALDILEYDDQLKGGEYLRTANRALTNRDTEFQHTCVTSLSELNGRLEGEPAHSLRDPRCRFM